MCSTISWSAFLQTIIILSVIYYSWLLLTFYRNDLIKWFSNFSKVKSKPVLQTATIPEAQRPMSYNEMTVATAESSLQEKENILRSSVHDLMEDLKIIFIEAAGDKTKKPELMLKIQKKLKEYPQIKGTAFETEITRLIEFESNEQCEIILSDEELNMLWNG
jgi:hypothetical protein